MINLTKEFQPIDSFADSSTVLKVRLKILKAQQVRLLNLR